MLVSDTACLVKENQWRPNFIDPPPIVQDMGQCKVLLVGHDSSKFVRDRSTSTMTHVVVKRQEWQAHNCESV